MRFSFCSVILVALIFCLALMSGAQTTETIRLYGGDNWIALPSPPVDPRVCIDESGHMAGVFKDWAELLELDCLIRIDGGAYNPTFPWQTEFDPLRLGEGYIASVFAPPGQIARTLTYEVEPGPPFDGTIDLQYNWPNRQYLIGIPGTANDHYAWSDCILTDGVSFYTMGQLQQAGAPHWMDTAFRTFDAVTQTQYYVPLDNAYLNVGQAYLISVYVSKDLALVMPGYPLPLKPSGAPAASDGTDVRMTGRVFASGGALGSRVFYMRDRTDWWGADLSSRAGIRVEAQTDAPSLQPGQELDVEVSGTLGKTADNERVLDATSVTLAAAHDSRGPLHMPNRSLGGKRKGYSFGCLPDTTSGAPNNVGMYVRSAGRVSGSESGRFWIDDGSGSPVLVKAPGLSLPANDSFVSVRGACGLTPDATPDDPTTNIATIRPAAPEDIVVLIPAP